MAEEEKEPVNKSLQEEEEEEEEDAEEEAMSRASVFWTTAKFVASAALLWTALAGRSDGAAVTTRRLQALGDTIPSYMNHLMTDLKERKKLFDETPPEEIKYWFEYTGPLQVS